MPSPADRPGDVPLKATSSASRPGPRLPVEEATVQLRDRGVLTLPKAFRERYGLVPGDALRVLDLDGVFVLTPLVPMVPELAREIERLCLEAGLSTEDLLDGLRRERYAGERFGLGVGGDERDRGNLPGADG